MTAPATLRDQRASRYSRLQKPIYITHPNILIPLLQDADFDRLPWYYQGEFISLFMRPAQSPTIISARTLEESRTGRET